MLKAFENTGVLWLAHNEEFLFARGKLADLKLYCQNDWSECPVRVTGKRSKIEAHDGFCRGDLYSEDDDGIVALPSKQSDVLVGRCGKTSAAAEIDILHVADGEESLREKCGLVTAVKLVPAKRMLSCYESGTLALWDWSAETVLHKLTPAPPFLTLCLDFDPSCDKGVAGGTDDSVMSFRLNREGSSYAIEVLRRRELPTKGLSHLVLRRTPEGKEVVVAGSWDGTVRLFSWKKPDKLKPLGALKFHSATVEGVACSELPVASKGNRHLICAASKDGKLSFWDIPL